MTLSEIVTLRADHHFNKLFLLIRREEQKEWSRLKSTMFEGASVESAYSELEGEKSRWFFNGNPEYTTAEYVIIPDHYKFQEKYGPWYS